MRRGVVLPILLFTAVALIAISVFAFWPQIELYRLTGSLYPVRKVDRLERPIGVTGWSENGLVLADGQTAKLRGIRKLPLQSEALTQATMQGVEITPDGRVFGLVRIHHWCGNDPVREHVARVDISEMMLFLGEGEPTSELPPEERGLQQRGGAFSQFGWNVSEFGAFEFWQKVRQLPSDSTP